MIMENQIEYNKQFKKLCPNLELNTNNFEFERAKEYIEYKKRDEIWERNNFYQFECKTFGRTDLSELLCINWDKVLKQPFWYLDLKDNINKPFLSAKIELSLDKLKEFSVGDYPDLVLDKFEYNEDGTKQLLRKILSFYSKKLEQSYMLFIGSLFNFKESPLFIGFYEFIGKIQESYFEFGGVNRFDKIDNYLKSIPELKQKFETNNSIKESSLPGFKTTLTETQITGFETTLKDQQQSNLYNALQNNYIDCSEVEFKALFTDEPNPIRWHKSNRLLAYFIGNCKQITDISKWKKASQIFETKYNLQQSLNTNPYPKGHDELQKILNSIE